MIIKSNERIYEIVIILILLFSVLWIAGCIKLDGDWSGWEGQLQLCITIIILIILYYGVKYCRKISLDEMGCTISFCGIKKKVFWREFQVKRIEYYNGRKAYNKNYAKGAFFSVKSRGHGASIYHFWTNPFASFQVYFVETKIRDYKSRAGGRIFIPDYYSVKEADFCNKLKAWGVVLEKPKEANTLNLKEIREQLGVQAIELKNPEK